MASSYYVYQNAIYAAQGSTQPEHQEEEEDEEEYEDENDRARKGGNVLPFW